ncbi:DNA-binding protein [Bacillus thuringiensis]
MNILSLLWMLLLPALVLTGIIAGIFLIIKGFMHKKLLISLLGLLTCLFTCMPYVSVLLIHLGSFFTFATGLYFGLLALTGFLTLLAGARSQMSSIRNTGGLICATALVGIFIF